MVVGASAQDMAMAMAMYPQMKPALDKMRAEGGKIAGHRDPHRHRMEAVPPGTADIRRPTRCPAPEEPKKKGFGGMLGGLKKMAEESQQKQTRATRSRSAPSS